MSKIATGVLDMKRLQAPRGGLQQGTIRGVANCNNALGLTGCLFDASAWEQQRPERATCEQLAFGMRRCAEAIGRLSIESLGAIGVPCDPGVAICQRQPEVVRMRANLGIEHAGALGPQTLIKSQAREACSGLVVVGLFREALETRRERIRRRSGGGSWGFNQRQGVDQAENCANRPCAAHVYGGCCAEATRLNLNVRCSRSART